MTPRRANYLMVDEADPQWVRFWNAYPKRVSKKDARKAWSELNPTPETVDLMIAALEWQSQQPSWTKDGGQFAPFPASWLRAERWEDEPPRQAQKADDRGHVPPCRSFTECTARALREARESSGLRLAQ